MKIGDAPWQGWDEGNGGTMLRPGEMRHGQLTPAAALRLVENVKAMILKLLNAVITELKEPFNKRP